MSVFKLAVVCDECRAEQSMTIHGFTRAEADHYTKLIDGTSPFYVKTPRGDPTTPFASCATCGGTFTASVEELDKVEP